MARRHESLLALSRDHHDALILAFRLLHPAPPHPVTAVTPESTVAERARWVQELFARSLRTHFAAEETALFPLLAAHRAPGTPPHALLARLREEHRTLEALHATIAAPPDDAALATALDAFGTLLEAHVRAEERELFAHFEAWVPAAAAAALGPAIDAVLAARAAVACAAPSSPGAAGGR